MAFLGLIFLLVAHYTSGYGLLNLFKIDLPPLKRRALCMIAGIVIISFVPFLLQLAYIPLTFGSVAISIIVLTLLLNIGTLKTWSPKIFQGFRLVPRFKVYELPFLLLFAFILFSSTWRSFYYPPNARDMLSGPEPIAEYAVKEHSMINSVFSVNLESTNNQLKPPFISGLQIVYKFFGFPFGQIWVAIMAIAFCVFLYQLLRERLHPLIASTLMLTFIAIPEVYAYTYIMLFDYSNMVLFFLSVYFLITYFVSHDKRQFYFSAVLMAFATFIRLETLVLAAMLLPMFWLFAFRNKTPVSKVILQSAAMVAFSAVIYFLWMNIYVKYYIPGHYTVESDVNHHLGNLSPFFNRLRDMTTQLLYGKFSVPLWAYFVNIFSIVFVLDLIISRKLSREARNWLYAAAVIYFGLPLLGYMLPLMDLMNTTKRGLFKLMPLLLLIMANTGILKNLSERLLRWETAPEKVPVPKPSSQKLPASSKPKKKHKTGR